MINGKRLGRNYGKLGMWKRLLTFLTVGLLAGTLTFSSGIVSTQAHNAGYTYCSAGQYYEDWSQAVGTGLGKNQIHYTVASGSCNWKIYWQEYGQTGGNYTTGTTMYNGGGSAFDNDGTFCTLPPTSGWSTPFYFSQINTTSALVDDVTKWGSCLGVIVLDYYPYNQP